MRWLTAMPYGKDGLVRDTQGLAMDDLSLTVGTSTKAWMAPPPRRNRRFLFDEIERYFTGDQPGHSGRVAGRARSDQARLAEHLGRNETLRAEHEALLKTYAALVRSTRERAEHACRAANRPEHRWRAAGAAGQPPSGMPYSSFLTQEAIISAMVAHHGNAMGITERTLQAKFALARRNLQSTTS